MKKFNSEEVIQKVRAEYLELKEVKKDLDWASFYFGFWQGVFFLNLDIEESDDNI